MLAAIIWSTGGPVARSLTEQVGPLTAGGTTQLVAGVIATIFFFKENQGYSHLRSKISLSACICGALFIFYFFFLYLSIGTAQNRQQYLEVGLVQYSWPTLTILFSLFLLNKKANIFLLVGLVLASTGIYLSLTAGKEISINTLVSNFKVNSLPYLLAFLAAVFWALYSNLTKRWSRSDSGNIVGLYMFGAGCALLVLRYFLKESSNWSFPAFFELAYLSVLSTSGYMLWEYAMKKGNVTTVVSFSFLTPLLYAIFGSFYLSVAPSREVWLACALIISGAVVSSKAVTDKQS